jgi:hypothetical protein
MPSWHHLGLRGMSLVAKRTRRRGDYHTRSRVRLREQVRKVDERAQGRKQRDFGTDYQVVWN